MPKRRHARVTVERIRALLRYDPDTGALTWISRHSIRIKFAGAPAGSLDPSGYVLVSLDYRRLRGHTLAWVLMTGEYPKGEIDHINGNRSDNRWANLRDVSHGKNMENQQRARRSSASGILGVVSHKGGAYFTAEISSKGKRRYLGCFKTPEAAQQAYQAAKALRDAA